MELTTLQNFAIALLIGALVGAEREKHKRGEDRVGVSGLRTFILLAMAGAVSAWLGVQVGTPWIFIATLPIVAGSLIAGYVICAVWLAVAALRLARRYRIVLDQPKSGTLLSCGSGKTTAKASDGRPR